MTKRMLIDATHAEETRVVVLDGNRLEDFDVETSTKKQLKGNIYLAKIVRVEPSLQAAFVEYGGGRHGFLAFGEIHPDYYQIPVADRERLIRLQAEEARAEEAAEEAADAAEASGRPLSPPIAAQDTAPAEPAFSETALPDAVAALPENMNGSAHGVPEPQGQADQVDLDVPIHAAPAPTGTTMMPELPAEEIAPEQGGMIDSSLPDAPPAPAEHLADTTSFADTSPGDAISDASFPEPAAEDTVETVAADDTPPPETMGGESEAGEDGRERRVPSRHLRNYKIQEVIRRRQILLIQVVKEERGTKGAALTTYISLAGRFSVLMPNSPRGGGISRKITSAADRRRLKEITTELEIPDGMGLIVRTAGANRPKPEIVRDCEYLLRLWDDIRETTMRSVAPALIHEEASLIKRAIRDVYSRDIDEILVDGEEGWRAARDVMRMLMPTHARKVISWRDNPASGGQPLFASQQVEAQLDAMMSPNVQLKSGGYLVINQAEALVAIDVNSGRSTRERGIEETALRTNLEAADEVARQLRLRDLAGLIVIDFIDMESKRHNAMVERRLKEALKVDRARIQVGSISHFGLMEMSRQRLRPSLAENSFVMCQHCGGLGHVRSTESAAIHVLRGIDEEGAKRRAAEIMVNVAPAIAMYILNHKRDRLLDIERRYGMQVLFSGDASLIAPAMRIDRLRAASQVTEPPPPVQVPIRAVEYVAPVVDDVEDDEVADDEIGATEQVAKPHTNGAAVPEAGGAEDEARRKRRRRRRRGGRRDEGGASPALPEVAELGAEQPDLIDNAAHDTAPDLTAELEAAAGLPAEPAEAMLSEAAPLAPAPEADAASDPAPMVAVATPGEDATEDGGAEPARRRGRRGGRRRRKDAPEGEATEIEPQMQLEPAYTGPTPANPFGGTPFDIFDVMEQAEQMPPPIAAVAVPLPLPEETPPVEAVAPVDVVHPAEAMPEPEAAPPILAEPVAEAPAAPERVAGPTIRRRAPRARVAKVAASKVEEPAPEPVAASEPVPEPVAAAEPAALPTVAEPELALAPEPVAAAEPAAAVPEAAPEPLIKPTLIDSAAPAPAARKGWWKR